MKNKDKKQRGFDSAAVVQKHLAGASRGIYYSDTVLKWGEDNLLPQRLNKAIMESPTAGGCTRHFSKFTIGRGIQGELGDQVVNRYGDTLNDILEYSVEDGYAKFYFFTLHFNFNLLGEITEIFAIDPQLARKTRDGKHVIIKDWAGSGYLSDDDGLFFDMFGGPSAPIEGMRRDGIAKYKGQVYCYQRSKNRAYPYAPLAQALQSVQYEDSAQTVALASAQNAFGPKAIVKYPGSGDESSEEFLKFKETMTDLCGPENAGSMALVMASSNADGETSSGNMVETIALPKDAQMEAFNKTSRDNIITTMIMPHILLGAANGGMFTETAYNEAYNVKIADSLYDQAKLARAFNDIISRSVWKGMGPVELLPAEIKKQSKPPDNF